MMHANAIFGLICAILGYTVFITIGNVEYATAPSLLQEDFATVPCFLYSEPRVFQELYTYPRMKTQSFSAFWMPALLDIGVVFREYCAGEELCITNLNAEYNISGNVTFKLASSLTLSLDLQALDFFCQAHYVTNTPATCLVPLRDKFTRGLTVNLTEWQTFELPEFNDTTTVVKAPAIPYVYIPEVQLFSWSFMHYFVEALVSLMAGSFLVALAILMGLCCQMHQCHWRRRRAAIPRVGSSSSTLLSRPSSRSLLAAKLGPLTPYSVKVHPLSSATASDGCGPGGMCEKSTHSSPPSPELPLAPSSAMTSLFSTRLPTLTDATLPTPKTAHQLEVLPAPTTTIILAEWPPAPTTPVTTRVKSTAAAAAAPATIVIPPPMTLLPPLTPPGSFNTPPRSATLLGLFRAAPVPGERRSDFYPELSPLPELDGDSGDWGSVQKASPQPPRAQHRPPRLPPDSVAIPPAESEQIPDTPTSVPATPNSLPDAGSSRSKATIITTTTGPTPPPSPPVPLSSVQQAVENRRPYERRGAATTVWDHMSPVAFLADLLALMMGFWASTTPTASRPASPGSPTPSTPAPVMATVCCAALREEAAGEGRQVATGEIPPPTDEGMKGQCRADILPNVLLSLGIFMQLGGVLAILLLIYLVGVFIDSVTSWDDTLHAIQGTLGCEILVGGYCLVMVSLTPTNLVAHTTLLMLGAALISFLAVFVDVTTDLSGVPLLQHWLQVALYVVSGVYCLALTVWRTRNWQLALSFALMPAIGVTQVMLAENLLLPFYLSLSDAWMIVFLVGYSLAWNGVELGLMIVYSLGIDLAMEGRRKPRGPGMVMTPNGSTMLRAPLQAIRALLTRTLLLQLSPGVPLVWLASPG
ncbi:hypothetical protein PAPYR_11780 [Paratrimastix pyriformis]|uniref:Uncharacterized protein n=1 Tax=Paratrimastix pyriformis TaxID=342808 RepID=A0ABQ8U8L9_9EUKA|nr:hypothetical protein PAPYR_11780 [Paratrimastix pyriformis]